MAHSVSKPHQPHQNLTKTNQILCPHQILATPHAHEPHMKILQFSESAKTCLNLTKELPNLAGPLPKHYQTTTPFEPIHGKSYQTLTKSSPGPNHAIMKYTPKPHPPYQTITDITEALPKPCPNTTTSIFKASPKH